MILLTTLVFGFVVAFPMRTDEKSVKGLADLQKYYHDTYPDLGKETVMMKLLADTENLVPKNNFLKAQIGWLFMIEWWEVNLGKMMTIVPSDWERISLAENIFEEHGEGKPPYATHVRIFKDFLISLGVKNPAILNDVNYPSKARDIGKKFTDYMNDFEETKDWMSSMVVLGMLEDSFASISRSIHSFALNYLEEKEIYHHVLHGELDEDHALGFFSTVAEHWEENQERIKKNLDEVFWKWKQMWDDMGVYMMEEEKDEDFEYLYQEL